MSNDDLTIEDMDLSHIHLAVTKNNVLSIKYVTSTVIINFKQYKILL